MYRKGDIMKFCVGLPKNNEDFINFVVQNAGHIHEVYFSWGDFVL